jgi:hypothetical protein
VAGDAVTWPEDLDVRVDTRLPSGVLLVGDRETLDRLLAEGWTTGSPYPDDPLRVAIEEGEVVALRVDRPDGVNGA